MNRSADRVGLLFTRRQLVRLMIPLILEQLFAVTIGMADTMMVAGCGEAAVSGISVVDAINFLFITCFSALATGGAVICSQYLGKKESYNASRAAKQLMYVCLLFGVVFSVVIGLFHTPILRLVYGHLEPDVMESAVIYFVITGFSLPFLALYQAGAAIFRTMGNSKISLYASLLMNIINVGGNAVLILGFRLSVTGAAVATLASRVVGAALLLRLVVNPSLPVYVSDIFHPMLDRRTVGSILKVAVPSGLENSMFQVGKLLTQAVITGFGTAAISANAVAGTITNLVYVCGTGVGLSLITVVGQCVGARQFEQARRYTARLLFFAVGCTVTVGSILFFTAPLILSFFSISAEASADAILLIRSCVVAAAFMHETAFVLPNALRAAGDVRFTMLVSVISMWTTRVLLSYVFAYGLGLGVLSVWLAMYTDWLVRSLLFLFRFYSGKWKNRNLV